MQLRFLDREMFLIRNIEDYRRLIIEDLRGLKSYGQVWPIWEPEINRLTSNLGDAQQVLNLGSSLRTVFQSTSVAGRGQGALSSAGTLWEALVCWYLNLVFSGANAVAIKQKKSLVPSCISDAATITYGTNPTNSESDIIVIVFPDDFFGSGFSSVEEMSESIHSNSSRFEVGIVQCKTNWNDNAQIPMLWDMVYRAKSFSSSSGISVGRNGKMLSDFRKFTYSFVTVPSQSVAYQPTSMAVKRVQNLSGRNYWGKPTQPGVALSLSEIFATNFRAAFTQPIPQSIRRAFSDRIGLFA